MYNAALAALAKGAQAERALALLDEMKAAAPRLEPNARTYSAAITACSRAGDWEAALGLWRELEGAGVRPDAVAYGAAIAACERGRRWETALELLGQMRSALKPGSLPAHNAAVSSCARAGRWQQAAEVLATMREKGPPPDVISYNALLAACSLAREWRPALAVLLRMCRPVRAGRSRDLRSPRRYYPRPDVVSFGAALACMERATQWPVALELLDLARAEGVSPDAACYASAASAVASGGGPTGWERGLALLKEAEASGLSIAGSAWEKVIVGAAGASRRGVDTARRLVRDELVPRGHAPTPRLRTSLLAACTRGRRWRDALELLDEVDKPTVAEVTAAAAACGASRRPDAALALLPRLQEGGLAPDARALHTFAWAAGRGARWPQALEVMRSMNASGLSLTATDFYGMATALCESEDAILTLRGQMRAEGLQVDPLSFYASALQGWHGGGGSSPQRLAEGLLRRMAFGELELERDVRVWNLLCDAALRPGRAAPPKRRAHRALVRAGDPAAPGFLAHLFEDLEPVGGEALVDVAYAEAVRAGALELRLPAARADVREIDVHGCSVPLARAAVRHELLELRAEAGLAAARGEAYLSPRRLVVITGIGRKAVLRRELTRLFATECKPPLKATVAPNNPGRLHVDEAALWSWCGVEAVGLDQ